MATAFAAAAFFFVAGIAAVAVAAGPVVNTNAGPVEGVDQGATRKWLGIPCVVACV